MALAQDGLSTLWNSRLGRVSGWQRYALSIGLVAAVTLIGLVTPGFFDPRSNLVILYLVPVVMSALFWGAGPSVVTSVLSILAYRLLFVPRNLAPSQIDDYVMFFSVVIVGLVVSTLATRAREQAIIAQHRADRLAALYDLSEDLAATSDLEGIVQALLGRISDELNCQAAVFLPAADGVTLRAATPGLHLTEPDRLRAAGVLKRSTEALAADPPTPSARPAEPQMLALTSVCCVVGVLAIRVRQDAPALTGEQQDLLRAFASQAALAIERARLAEEARQSYLDQETQKLQTALLNSVSHDLRTPLASISGALSSLLDSEVTLDEGTRRGLTESAYREAQRLNHLVGNLLDMTRLQAGAMRPVREPCDVQDLIGAALAQLGDRLRQRKVVVDAPILPMAPMDFALMTQALVNLLDNALKYSPPDSAVEIRARIDDSTLNIEVADRGTGIAADDLPHVFDSFYRAEHSVHANGAGLGLSISKGIVELHGGRLTVANRPGGGAVFRLELPLPTAEPVETTV